MTTHEDNRDYRTTTDTHWSPKVALEVDPGEVTVSFSVRNGQVRVVKDGSTLFSSSNSDEDYREFQYADYSEGSTYEFQLAGYGEGECRVEEICIETVESPEEEEEEQTEE